MSVCVGWLCPPSPAFITGQEEYFEASREEPSFGFLMAITSTYDETTLIVSAKVSPFVDDDEAESAKPSTEPPSLSIAASNESRVLVLGSKKSVARIFPRHTSLKDLGSTIICSAREQISSISETVKSPGSIKFLPANIP